MTSAMRLRRVERVEQPNAKQTTLVLDCGHRQDREKMHPMDVPKNVLCDQCGRATLRRHREPA